MQSPPQPVRADLKLEMSGEETKVSEKETVKEEPNTNAQDDEKQPATKTARKELNVDHRAGFSGKMEEEGKSADFGVNEPSGSHPAGIRKQLRGMTTHAFNYMKDQVPINIAGGDHPIQLIDEHGSMKEDDLEKLLKDVNLPDKGIHYLVVSIIGPQSSGKSTLMNCIFGTKFKTMDKKRRKRTTKGIWMDGFAFEETTAIVMDLEGSGGRERGEDARFERQSALFACVLSNVLLVNMWYKDVGLEDAASKPLLTTAFQEMVKSFEETNWRKTLLLTIRDSDYQESLDEVEENLREFLRKIWDGVKKPNYYKNKEFASFFQVKVVFFPLYDHEKENFKEKVVEVQQFLGNFSGGGNILRVPGSSFSCSLKELWNLIKKQESLNMPATRVLIADKRCQQIAEKKFESLQTDKHLSCHRKEAQGNLQTNFGQKLVEEIMEKYLTAYDEETELLDDQARSNNRSKFKQRIIEFFNGVFREILGSRRKLFLDSFKRKFVYDLKKKGFVVAAPLHGIEKCMQEFDESRADADIGLSWDATEVVDEVRYSIKEEAEKYLKEFSKKQLEEEIEGKLDDYLLAADAETWQNIRMLLRGALEKYEKHLSSALQLFEIVEETTEELLDNMRDDATKFVKQKATQEAKDQRILQLMHTRFREISDKWDIAVDFNLQVRYAYTYSLNVLVVRAAMRLDDDQEDDINSILRCLLEGEKEEAAAWTDCLETDSWPKVVDAKTILKPSECKRLWSQHQEQQNLIVKLAETSVKIGKNPMASF